MKRKSTIPALTLAAIAAGLQLSAAIADTGSIADASYLNSWQQAIEEVQGMEPKWG